MTVARNTNPKHIGKLNADQIAALKEQHGITEVFETKVKDKKGDLHYGYFKQASRHDISAAQIAGSNGSKVSFWEVIANQCFLQGSQILLSDDYLFLGMMGVLYELYEVADADIAKL